MKCKYQVQRSQTKAKIECRDLHLVFTLTDFTFSGLVTGCRPPFQMQISPSAHCCISSHFLSGYLVHCALCVDLYKYKGIVNPKRCYKLLSYAYNAILYRASTGPEQGFPCEVFHTGKNLFSLQRTTVLIAGTPVFITRISL